MISINKFSMQQTLRKYLNLYTPIFHQETFISFYWVIVAILSAEEIRSIKFLFDNFIQKFCHKSLNSVYHFFSYAKFSSEYLMIATVKIIISLIPKDLKGSTIFLSIDDTLQPKFGKKFDCSYKFFDHSNKTGSSYLNGHCFVSLVVSIPLWNKEKVRFLSLPISYKLYDKTSSKLMLAANLIDKIVPLLIDFQVILLCDSWYSKGAIIDVVKKYSHVELNAAIRSDTAIYALPPRKTGKKGRPRKFGEKLDIKNFTYKKVGDYYVATKQVLTNLFENPVYITVTVKNIEKFSSVRMYISTIETEKIHVFSHHSLEDSEIDQKNKEYWHLNAYHFRWNIEVIFYQHKFFWSFGNYMVRNKLAIERYANLIAISFVFITILPFIDTRFCDYRFQSPQKIKRVVAFKIQEELILGSFVSKLENTKIYFIIKKAIDSFLNCEYIA